jgi:MoxR-like ATPase
LVGPTGSGKTEFARNFAALTGRRFYRVSFSKQLFADSLLGKTEIRGGDTVFIPGPLIPAIQTPCVVLLDEVSRASADMAMAVLQPLLDNRRITIQDTGEVIECHPGCVLMGADNTLGLGEDSGRYAAATVHDASTLNRWAVTVQVPYLPEDTQSDIIQSKTGVPARIAKNLAKFAVLCQKSFLQEDGAGLPVAFSLRQGIAIGRMIAAGMTPAVALSAGFLNALPSSSRGIAEGFKAVVKF